MSDYITSLIRTAVPYVVGAVASYLATKGIDRGEEAKLGLGTFLTTLVGSLYYALVRFLEKKNPQAGKLLGIAKKPSY